MLDILMSGCDGYKCFLVKHEPALGPSSLNPIKYLPMGRSGWVFTRFETAYAGALRHPDDHITKEMIEANIPIGTRCGFWFWPFPDLKCGAYQGWVTWADIQSKEDYRFYVIKRYDNPAENPFSAPDRGDSGLMQSPDSQGYDLTSSSSSTDSTSSGSDQGSGSSPYLYEAHQSFHFMHGTAYLLEKVVNVIIGEQEERMTMTGLHTVADIFCVGCGSIVGCKYEAALEKRQKYKEGKFVLERYWGLTEATM